MDLKIYTTTQRRVARLLSYFHERELYFRNKWTRARNHERRANHYNRMKLYGEFSSRAYALFDRVTYPKKFGENNIYIIQAEINRYYYGLREKEIRKQRFLDNHKYSKWFMSDSLGSDYGTFVCDCCGITFHHSPSSISKGQNEVYHCACGNCTNDIIYKDWKKKPYQ